MVLAEISYDILTTYGQDASTYLLLLEELVRAARTA